MPQTYPQTREDSGPHLVPRCHPSVRHSLLALWHLLSLDAPTVAALWTLFIAHCAAISLPWPEPTAMFVAVWMIYAADRLLDARLLDTDPPSGHEHLPRGCNSVIRSEGAFFPSKTLWNTLSRIPGNKEDDLEARHRFHHRHRSHFLAVITLGALALVYLLHRIDARALHLYVLLATLLGAWMLLIHARPLPNGITRRLPKELAVGLFFPAAIFIPTIARAPWLRPMLLPAAILFACVCTLNCLYVYAWEHAAPRLHAHWTTRWSTQHLTGITALTISISALTAVLCLAHHSLTQHNLPIGRASGIAALACALSATLLLLLEAARKHLSAIHLRASADLVLLTPLLCMPLLHVLAK